MKKNVNASCVDLFAGAGGLALGMHRAGFDVAAVVEVDDVAGASYREHILKDNRDAFVALGAKDGDVRGIDFGQVSAHLKGQGIERVDLVAGGPPCQGFSKAGRGKLNHLDDELGSFSRDRRNSLIFDFCRAVRVLRPRAVLVENVTGILNVNGENHANLICRELVGAGYSVRVSVLNAAWYGVPQDRERFFLIALAEDVPVPERWFPEPVHYGRERRLGGSNIDLRNAVFDSPEWVEIVVPDSKAPPPITVGDAFDDLPRFTAHLTDDNYVCSREAHPPARYRRAARSAFAQDMRAWPGLIESTRVRDHYCRYTPRDFEIFRRMKPGDLYPDAIQIAAQLYRDAVNAWDASSEQPQPSPEDFIPPYPLGSFAERWQKLRNDAPSWTITAHLSKDCYSHIHPDDDQARTISIREAARLQSFPDSLDFSGNTGDCFRQIGNAVPPLLGYHLAQEIMVHLSRPAPVRVRDQWQTVSLPASPWQDFPRV